MIYDYTDISKNIPIDAFDFRDLSDVQKKVVSPIIKNNTWKDTF
jgi:hypothetical protein